MNAMHRMIVLLCIAGGLLMMGCGDPAKEWFDTAELETLQNSHEHARRLYERILAEYPDSEYAPRAKARLEAMRENQLSPSSASGDGSGGGK